MHTCLNGSCLGSFPPTLEEELRAMAMPIAVVTNEHSFCARAEKVEPGEHVCMQMLCFSIVQNFAHIFFEENFPSSL